MAKINIWSSPRNVSTALMYAFAQRPDTVVVDEPLYAHYLTKSGKNHPGAAEILATMEPSGEKVVAKFLGNEWEKEVVVFKQMTHHLIELDRDFIFKMDNILLIRQPKEIIYSYSKVIPKVGIEDIGIRMQFELYHQLTDKGKNCIVLDTKNLLKNPWKCLKKLCELLDIPFYKRMLNWKAGHRPEDGVWAKYWYKNVHLSTGFAPYIKKDIHLEGPLAELAEDCKPYYQILYDRSIHV